MEKKNSKSLVLSISCIVIFFIVALCALSLCDRKTNKTVTSGFKELDESVKVWKEGQKSTFGYPANQESALDEFYNWYTGTGMDIVNLNNAGDPMTDNPSKMSTQKYEREVIEYFAPLYGYDVNNVWGIVTNSGTDGNNHGIYFGSKKLIEETGMRPVVYVSEEAHYSNMRLCDLQSLDVVLIKSDEMGRMIPEELEKSLITERPCLIVYAMGSTFKGAIDDMEALNKVLEAHPELPGVYRHLDAALFGGYLPFTDNKDMVSHKKMGFDSIAVSGHKFFGIDSPCGIFLCTKDVYEDQSSYNVPYLNNNMRMISCSRDAVQPLKFWWLIHKVGEKEWSKQAKNMMECKQYLCQKLSEIGWPFWVNEYSNTVFFKRPSQEIIDKYCLAGGYDKRFGGNLSHVVVMQHVTKEAIDTFVSDLISSNP